VKKIIFLFLLNILINADSPKKYSENDLEVKQSLIPKAGKGVFAKTDIPERVVLGSYTGKFITHKEHLELEKKGKWQYVMGLHYCAYENSKDFTAIDGINGNVFSKINYAPRQFQNTEFIKICEPPYVQIITIKPISKGQELYVDYGIHYIYDFMEDPIIKEYFEKLGK
jgi:hypothetical protein